MNQTSDIIFGDGMSYDQIVAILTRASIQNGSGYVLTACAEFIHSVQSTNPALAKVFTDHMVRMSTVRDDIARDVEEALQPVIGGAR